ncbi:MAG: SGNH/GDSL hydrolase family protein [Desulfobaccales bacterium]
MTMSGPSLTDNSRPVQKTLSWRRRLLFAVIMVLVTIALIEGGLKIIYALKDKGNLTAKDKAARNPVYANLDWAMEMFAEEDRIHPLFVPYIMWRSQEFHGKHINITPAGLRKTWNPPLKEKEQVRRVFCFGGSTTWGVGARDDFTLPSLLSKRLNQGQTRYVVENYGEKGFSLTQEVINLVLLLKQGHIPDYVIFYDGINEVMVGTKNGEPGSIFGAETIRRQLFRRDKETAWRKIVNELGRTKIYQAFTDLSRLVQPRQSQEGGFSPEDEISMNRLAQAIVQDYLRNIEVVKRLAQAYGFKPLFVWQPSPCTTKALTPEEKDMIAAWEEKKMVRMYRLVYEKMLPVKMDNFYNISDIFDNKEESVFISWAHLTEKGNDLVAQRLAAICQQEFPEASRH